MRVRTLLVVVLLSAFALAGYLEFRRLRSSWLRHATEAGKAQVRIGMIQSELIDLRRHVGPGHVCPGCQHTKPQILSLIKQKEEQIPELERSFEEHRSRAGLETTRPVVHR